ncbi:hypothetical protein BRAT_05710 [Leptospira interrogans serovar Bratislava]|nr:hypothetical protein BRAT_05710 [Leptospira interrogans serovar Bratislava]
MINLCMYFLFAKSVSFSSWFSNQKILKFRLIRFNFDSLENFSFINDLDKKVANQLVYDHATKNRIELYIHKFLFKI